MKICRTCQQAKPLDGFPINRGMSDGHLHHCSSCRSIRNREDREARAELYRERDRIRNASPKRVEERREWKASNREKTKAHNNLNYEIRAGRMERGACEVCGNAKTDAHHHDYSKPLDVRWLCRRHHILEHAGQQGAVA